MSSLVLKERQQVVKADDDTSIAEQHQISNPVSCQSKKFLQKRSVSFEKLLVTAFHIRLACSKCSRESLKLCFEMLIFRMRIIAQHSIVAFKLMLANLMQLSHEWNNKILEIANVIIPKWQIRARQIVDATILQRQWRRQQEKRIKAVAVKSKRDVIEEVVEEEEAREIDNSFASSEARTEAVAEQVVVARERSMRQGLLFAVTGCAIFLAAQVCLGIVLLAHSSVIPLGLIFQLVCICYIGYLLQSICEYDRINRTNCNFGRAKNSPQRASKVIFIESSDRGAEAGKRTKVIELSFIERTMSKVKLL